MLERLLAAAGSAPASSTRSRSAAGPGSFTGLRIACGLAQGSLCARAAGIGIPTLEALAEESGAARVVACLDARMREVYYAALEKRGRAVARSDSAVFA